MKKLSLFLIFVFMLSIFSGTQMFAAQNTENPQVTYSKEELEKKKRTTLPDKSRDKKNNEVSREVTVLLADSYEPNNSISAAKPISNNNTIYPTIDTSSDVDYFTFTISSTANAVISMTPPSDKDYDLKLYNSSGTEVGSSTNGTGTTDSITNTSLPSGTYYIYVYGYSGAYSETSYSLRLSYTGGGGSGDDYGNDFSSAYSLSVSAGTTTSRSGSIESTGDADFFKFTAPSSGTYTIYSTGSTDTYGHLYNSSQSELASNDDNSASNFLISYSLTAGQLYYVKVRHYSSSGTGEYTLNITAPIPVANAYSNIAKLLYVGYANTRNGTSKYASYTDSDLDSILNSPTLGTNEFVITGGDCGYGFKQCVAMTDINSLTTSGTTAYNYCGTTDSASLNTIKNEAVNVYNSIDSYRTLESFADDQITLANRIWAKNPNAKVWFSFPVIPHTTFAYLYTSQCRTKIVDRIKDSISSTNWSNNVLGFYYGTESPTQWYTKFNTSNTTDFNNPVVNNMNGLSSYVHGFSKKMLWIPYYRDGSSTSTSDLPRRLAYISCRTNIFDYVDLQPSYYFNSALTNNLNLVKICVQNNTIVNSSGNAIVSKTSSTQIGCEMEIDTDINSDSSALSRYNQYVSAFSSYRGSKHISFYCSERNSLINTNVFNTVRSFVTY
ncbi:MAG: DUF4855 domain-containing protein [Clostridia bacterium]|nr:DUF4855 domain-containing protein [Clostridia bacterium]